MKKTVVGTFVLIILAAAVWGGYLAWETWRVRQAGDALSKVAQSADLENLLSTPPDGAEEAIDLALRGVKLAQGEAGRETWTLDADWATLRQESGLVQVRDPIIHYTLGDPDQPGDARQAGEEPRQVVVTADMGSVEDDNTLLTMRGHVRATYEDSVLTGPVAVFRNDTRILTFPDTARLDGPVLEGTAGVLRWNMATNILEGEKGVDVLWTPQPSQPPQTAKAGQSADAASAPPVLSNAPNALNALPGVTETTP